MAFEENIPEFFDEADFAEQMSVVQGGGPAVTLLGIFDRSFVDTGGIEGFAPTFLCDRTAADAAAPGTTMVQGVVMDRVDEALQRYVVVGLEPGDVGATLLIILEKQ